MGDTIVIETPVATVLEVSGLQGPQGPTGPQGPSGEASGSLPWTSITGKPSTFTPSSHTHVAADVTDFASAVVAAAPPTTNASLLTSGTLADARLSAAVTTSLGKADTASQPGHTHAVSDVTGLQTALDGKQASGSYAAASHTHTPSEVGLGNVSNTAQVTSVSGTAPIVSSGGTTPAISLQNSPTLTGDVRVNGATAGVTGSLQVGSTTGSFARDVELNGGGLVLRNIGASGVVTIARAAHGTFNYTLTPPAASGTIALTGHTHPISDVSGLQTALDGKQASGNYATLVSGKVPSDQLPSFVDDVVEYANLAAFPVTGESGKIYVAIDTRKTYRWSGSAYVEISPSEVTSVNGATGAVTVTVPSASSTTPAALGTAAVGSASTFARADHVHAMPSAQDVGALDSNFTHETFLYDDLGGTGSMDLPARRNVRWSVNFLVSGGTRTLFLPSTDVLVGDRIHLTVEAPANTTVIVRRPNPGASVILTTLTGGQRLVYAAQVMRIVTGTPLWRTFTELQSVFGSVPAASNSNGIFGSFVFDNSFMYVAIADNTWRRIPIAAF